MSAKSTFQAVFDKAEESTIPEMQSFYITLPKHGYQVVNEADELSAINTDTLMKAFLQDGLVKEWQLQAGASQFEETPWAKFTDDKDSSAKILCKRINMVMPIPKLPMCADESRVIVYYWLRLEEDDGSIRLESLSQSLDAPFCTYFTNAERAVFRDAKDENGNDCVTMKKECGCNFVKFMMMKSQVSKNVASSSAEGTKFLEQAITKITQA
ncbi:hypothetical protein Pmar_PMAR023200 [Perkinsus marinus ATCC 50983]|uniref:VASt domain-containing protein n=1 Tax=Perkinsus marinus (strain ATCC 50983 / TXsc) TaxID=423536 RepID=C5LJG0_PERM5|nr:hypothetical protein Pmar_PMAR023200 [Perkinsus marinus ATCC 50983]EER03089.1 hypothetical protein Pmar_PMAR023200 [Perkinsus marinus ATCC 50983]|eukprot:XP_002771273.1 hypothetical protein Pmar_PMAR023200 [Perkinsus marinus ATCC 50983]